MGEQTTPEPHSYLPLHLAKHVFRGLLPMFAHVWSQARETAPQDSLNAEIWPEYERVLRACQEVLAHAPMHPNECKQANLEVSFDRALERLATTLAESLPGGLGELQNYIITDALRERRRAHRRLAHVRNAPKKTSLSESEVQADG